jgi:hypothetical protein
MRTDEVAVPRPARSGVVASFTYGGSGLHNSYATERHCYVMKKVAEVLKGLREEERRLSVELLGVRRAIGALEEVMGTGAVQAPERADRTAAA